MLGSSIVDRIAGMRFARYHLNRISNLPAFDPIFNILANRVSVGFRRLTKIGLKPSIVLDVGASAGVWATAHLPLFPGAKFVMIEAQPSLEPALRRVEAQSGGRARVVIAMLGPHEAKAITFYLADTGSSRLEEMTSFPREAIQLPMTTLDAVAGNLANETVLLKMDVQGGELDVLAGATATLRSVEVILMEASVVAYNAGAPRFLEVVVELDKLGFRLFDIWDLRRIGGVLAQCDLVFVRKNGQFEKHAQNMIKAYGN